MRKLFKKLKNAKGAVTIEATISLTTFLFLFLMIYSIITICRAQATLQVAINATAKEISQYSYLYSITGINQAMGNVSTSAEGTKESVNTVASNVSQVFSSIQSIGNTDVDLGDPQQMMSSWDSITEDLKTAGAAATGAQEEIAKMLEQEPHKVIFGMAQLIASEGFELAKSLFAEAVSRALVQKHLVSNKDGTAEQFCKAMGIIPGTYLGKQSYFNGIDFSHSRLMPYGSNEITIVANYKVRLLPLLPINIEYHITQSAVTLAWMQGDVEIPDTPEAVVNKRNDYLWNGENQNERERLVRNMGIKDLKEKGYYSVSGNSYVHAYNPDDPQTFAVVRSYNPLEGYNSVDAINPAELVARLEKISSQVESSMDNIHTVNIKKPDANGNLKTQEVNCDGDIKMKVILVIPEDEGLQKKMEEALKSVNTDVEFEFVTGYGTVFETEQDKTADITEE